MSSPNTYHLTWVSLTLDNWVSLQPCSSKVQLLLLALDELASLHLQRELGPFGPPATHTAPAPWTWVCSSQLLLLTSDMG